MPTTTYQYESGGDPEAIPTLTWNALKNFHATHYHPSNGRYKIQNRFLFFYFFKLDFLLMDHFHYLIHLNFLIIILIIMKKLN
jgi:hypothetical protein